MPNLNPQLNPETLAEESVGERTARQCQTGVLGNGHFVDCHPTGEEDVSEKKHRATCLVRPYPACGSCAHSNFKLVFNADLSAKHQQVRCPRWANDGFRMEGRQPDEYVPTEVMTCAERPFPYCGSCPSMETLSQIFIDKKKDGWCSRLKRVQEFLEEDNE